jgi:hypothetical protein
VREAQRPENDGLEHDGSNDTFEQTSVFIMDRLHQAVAPGARSKFTLARQINTCRRTTTCSPCTSRPGLGFFWRQISGAPTDLRNAGALGLTTFTGDRGVMSLTHDRLAEAAGIARACAMRRAGNPQSAQWRKPTRAYTRGPDWAGMEQVEGMPC